MRSFILVMVVCLYVVSVGVVYPQGYSAEVVHAKDEPSSPDTQEKGFTLVSKNLDVRDILQMIGRTCKVNLMVGPHVRGRLSVTFKSTEPMQAIEDVCTALDLRFVTFESADKIVIVHRADSGKQKGANEDFQRLLPVGSKKLSLVNKAFPVDAAFLYAGKMGQFDVVLSQKTTEKLKNLTMAFELLNVSPIRVIEAICLVNTLKVTDSPHGQTGKRTLHITVDSPVLPEP